MRTTLVGLTLAALMAVLAATPVAAATTISGGNDVIARPYLDTYQNFVIVDTNHPISGNGVLTGWSFWAGTTGGVQLVVVRGSHSGSASVVGTSPVVNAPATGVVVNETLSPSIIVQAGDYVGLYFQSTGVVPYSGTPSAGTSGTVLYTSNGYGDPKQGDTLEFQGAVDRMYSVAVSGFAYTFSGFFAPISNTATNTVKAGSAVPVKFSLGGDQGLDIFAAGYPQMQRVTCGTTTSEGTALDTVTAGGSSLTYDPTSDQYTYVWKTDKSWSGTCGQLVVQFVDGSTETATFAFK